MFLKKYQKSFLKQQLCWGKEGDRWKAYSP